MPEESHYLFFCEELLEVDTESLLKSTDALNDFILSEPFRQLDWTERGLLQRQALRQGELLDILQARIRFAADAAAEIETDNLGDMVVHEGDEK